MRTIVVGDVHGCRIELEALLDRIAFASGDRLVFVGDLLVRGPDSLGVLDIVRRTGAIVVRGNHEQRLIDWRDARLRAMHGQDGAQVGVKAPTPKMHRDLARELRPVDWTLLDTAPAAFHLPEHGACVVHAGVVPGIPIDDQKPEDLMRIRTIRVTGGTRTRGKRNVLWGSQYQGPPHVVFGHNAAPGLQLHPWATGLDTGCVYGGRLTALVLAPGQRIPRVHAARRELLVSEPARRMWFVPAHRPPSKEA